MNDNLYIVYWENIYDDKKGNGQPISKELAEATVKSLNSTMKTVKHWCEPANKSIFIKK